MAITVEEINAAIDNDSALVGQVLGHIEGPAMNYFTQKGYTVRNKDQETSFLDNYKNQLIEQEMPARVKEVHDRYDEDLFNLTGERKQPNEKTYDFLKRKINEIKSSKIEDPVLKEQLLTLQKNLEQQTLNHKGELDKIEKDYFTREVKLMIRSDLNSVNIAIPAHLKTDEEKQKYVTSQRSMIERDMLENIPAKKDKDGNIVFYEGDKPLTSTSDGKPLKASDIIKERYAFYITAGAQQTTGAGTGGNGGGDQKFTSKQQVYDSLIAKGLQPNTKVFNDEYGKLVKEQGILN